MRRTCVEAAYERSSLNALYEKVDELTDLELDELRARLREMRCSTTNTADSVRRMVGVAGRPLPSATDHPGPIRNGC